MSNLLRDKILVGRQYVSTEEALCVDCKKPFKFGENIFTNDGWAEVKISGTCESCFDGYFDPEYYNT